MKKMLISLVFALAALTTSVSAVNLYVDTTRIDTDAPPTIVDGSTLVPVRAIFESLGAEVEWNADLRMATGKRGEDVVQMVIDSTTAYINGKPSELGVPAQIINNRTMVPARFVSEALGCKVTWDGETSTAAVADQLRDQHIYITPTGKHYHFDDSCNGGTYIESSLAAALGRRLTPCDKCVLTNAYFLEHPYVPEETPQISQPAEGVQANPSSAETSSGVSPDAAHSGGSGGNGSNFDTYDNPDQQNTSMRYVLNTKTMKVHHPDCSSVLKIAPENYATSNLSIEELEAQGYSRCKQKDESSIWE